MFALEFTVDHNLRILDCNDMLRNAQRTDKNLQGSVYHEVLPRLLWDGRDAVEAVLDSAVPLTLDNYLFNCFCDHFMADIEVLPIADVSGQDRGARVVIKTNTSCKVVDHLNASQPLISIGKNASILSHGLRNPLNAIKGAVVYLKGRYDNEATLLEFADIMEQEIGRLEDFITNFLSSTIDASEKMPIDINDLLKKIKTFTLLQAQTSNVDIHFEFGETAPVFVNELQMEHAILNIINNALNVLPTEGRILVESLAEEIDGQQWVTVKVTDNGPGFPDRVDTDCQSPVQQTAESNGKGFGLFITREVLQHHGGQLKICRNGSGGTMIKMLLPVIGRGDSQ